MLLQPKRPSPLHNNFSHCGIYFALHFNNSSVLQNLSFYTWTQQKNELNSLSSSFRKANRPTFQDFKVTKLLLVVVCVFVACWTPHIVVNLLNGFAVIQPIPRILDAISTFLAFLSSSCNPFIYGLMNKKFRKGFRAILCAPCQKCAKTKTSKLERKISGETTRNLSSQSRSSHKREWKVVAEAAPTLYETCV